MANIYDNNPSIYDNNKSMEDKSQGMHLDKNITKENNLLRACYRLTLAEQRIILCCIAQIDSRKPFFQQPDKPINHYYLVSAKDYAEMFDLELKAVYGELKDAMERLWNRTVYTKDKSWKKAYRWIGGKQWNDEEGAVQISFSREIEPYLMGIHAQLQFTSYKLRDVANLKSVYSIRLFEMMMQFKSTGLLDIKVEEFKKILDIEDKYAVFSDLRKRVINPAIDELEQKNDMIIKFETKRKGRKIDRLIFRFAKNPQQKLL